MLGLIAQAFSRNSIYLTDLVLKSSSAGILAACKPSLPSLLAHHQVRCKPRILGRPGKSYKRGLRKLTNKAAWEAVRPFLAPRPQEEVDKIKAFRNVPIVDTCIPPIPTVPEPKPYVKVGTITGPYALQVEKKFAVIEIAGTQYKVTTDDVIFTNRIHELEINDVVSLNRVLLLGTRTSTIIGRPFVPHANVLAAVEEQFHNGIVHVFKLKPAGRYRRYKQHRDLMTTFRILSIQGIDVPAEDELKEKNILPMQLYRLLPKFKLPLASSPTLLSVDSSSDEAKTRTQ